MGGRGDGVSHKSDDSLFSQIVAFVKTISGNRGEIETVGSRSNSTASVRVGVGNHRDKMKNESTERIWTQLKLPNSL